MLHFWPLQKIQKFKNSFLPDNNIYLYLLSISLRKVSKFGADQSRAIWELGKAPWVAHCYQTNLLLVLVKLSIVLN